MKSEKTIEQATIKLYLLGIAGKKERQLVESVMNADSAFQKEIMLMQQELKEKSKALIASKQC